MKFYGSNFLLSCHVRPRTLLLNFDLPRHDGIEDFWRQRHIVLLPFVQEIERVRHQAGVEALLHQRRLQVLERARDVQGVLQPQVSEHVHAVSEGVAARWRGRRITEEQRLSPGP